MAKKKRPTKNKGESFTSTPFRTLKGVAVSVPEEVPESLDTPSPDETPDAGRERSFAEEMDFLGVNPLGEPQVPVAEQQAETADPEDDLQQEQTDQKLFLESLGQLDKQFVDRFPSEERPSQPRRMKQFKQGRLTPDASLDLHGLFRHQVAEKVEHFLRNASHQGWQTLLIITGRGLHSTDGQAVLRDEVEKYLAAADKKLITEWGRAPRQHGGEGALVVFLKKTKLENN